MTFIGRKIKDNKSIQIISTVSTQHFQQNVRSQYHTWVSSQSWTFLQLLAPTIPVLTIPWPDSCRSSRTIRVSCRTTFITNLYSTREDWDRIPIRIWFTLVNSSAKLNSDDESPIYAVWDVFAWCYIVNMLEYYP